MECDYCGVDVPEDEDECPSCGGGDYVCSGCGETVSQEDYEQCGASCPHCGTV